MVFVDGTSVFNRLRAAKIKVDRLQWLINTFLPGRRILRIYLYSVDRHIAEAITYHGDLLLQGIRTIKGHDVPSASGNREKGVDAQLVADLTYHAASKNCDYAVLVSHDTDFVYALKRVEDFGCRTAVLAFCEAAPPALADSCDDYLEASVEAILSSGRASREAQA